MWLTKKHCKIYEVWMERELLFNGYALSPCELLGEVNAKDFASACRKVLRRLGLPYAKHKDGTFTYRKCRLYPSLGEAKKASLERYAIEPVDFN